MIQDKVVATFNRVEPWWRLINMAVFIAAFFGPWGTIYGDMMYGTDVFRMSLAFVMDWTCTDYGPWLFFSLYWCFGWGYFGLHWFVNGVRAFSKSNIWKKPWFNIPLAASTAFLLLHMFPRMFKDLYNRFWWPSYYWGYWLLLFSIGSSVVIETIRCLADHIDKKRT
ncbi:MAG: hypothetical protein JXA89_12740 [Anaerolineae bacterium]|nr:hypothetical protein [Anaerolineae bacterium]